MDHKQRFTGWRRRMPRKTTQYLVDQVVARIVPEFERHGFVWYPDFAGNDPQEIGANEIPLQRREGADWPTVQITFLKGAWGPRFRIMFSALPKICKNPIRDATPREQAIAVYGPAYFFLERGVWKDLDSSVFGFDWMPLLLPTPRNVFRLIRYLLNWRKFLDSEVDAALALLPVLFDIFDRGIPQEWIDHDFGRITPNVTLGGSWRRLDELQKKKLKEKQLRAGILRMRPAPGSYLAVPLIFSIPFMLILMYAMFNGRDAWGGFFAILGFDAAWIIWMSGREIIVDDTKLIYRFLFRSRSIRLDEIKEVQEADSFLRLTPIDSRMPTIEIDSRPFAKRDLWWELLDRLGVQARQAYEQGEK